MQYNNVLLTKILGTNVNASRLASPSIAACVRLHRSRLRHESSFVVKRFLSGGPKPVGSGRRVGSYAARLGPHLHEAPLFVSEAVAARSARAR